MIKTPLFTMHSYREGLVLQKSIQCCILWYVISYNIIMSEDVFKQVKSIALVVLVLAVVFYVYHYSRSVNQSYPTRTFAVDGEADMETATDIATFTASVVTEGGNNVADIQRKNIEKMNAINAFLTKHGVEKKDLKTNQYTLSPRYSYTNCNEQSVCPPAFISGYTLTQTLTIKARNLETLGELLSGITENGANTVSGISFMVDDDTVARQKARTEAIADAQTKAKEIAHAGNFRIGKLLSIYEDSEISPDNPVNYEDMSSVSAALKEVPIVEPGTLSGTIRMNLTYEIKD